MKRTWKLLLLAALSACTFLLFINGPDIVISHEARVAQPARLMAAFAPYRSLATMHLWTYLKEAA